MHEPRATALVITVDTEADNEWDHDRKPSFANIEGMGDFQQCCEAYGAKPTYLVTYDVACQPACVEVLREISADGRAEIGAHLHPWSTPPFDHEPPGHGHPYLYEYPPETQRAKLTNLTEKLTEQFDHRPTSYRAGRWGINEVGLQILQELGYKVDTSVVPLTSLRHCSGKTMPGPEFWSCPRDPYFPSPEDLRRLGSGGPLEVPVSIGTLGPLAGFLGSALQRGGAGANYLRRGLRKARLAHLVRLEPVDQSLPLMVRLADALLTQQAPVLNLAIHSSEWQAGYSPTIADEASEKSLHTRFQGLFEHLQPRVESMGLSEFGARWAQALGAQAEASCGQ